MTGWAWNWNYNWRSGNHAGGEERSLQTAVFAFPGFTGCRPLLWGPGRTWILLILTGVVLRRLVLGVAFESRQGDCAERVPAHLAKRRTYTVAGLDPYRSPAREIFRDASLDDPQHPLSLMDDDLVERVKSAFSLHPWIARVVRVEKFYPGRVVVDVVYRHPVCMVEVLGELLPVDVEGVVLPKEDFLQRGAEPVPAAGENREPAAGAGGHAVGRCPGGRRGGNCGGLVLTVG